jgi:uncharacterized protein
MTPDADGAKRFYDAVMGWTVEPRGDGPMDYRMIASSDGLAGGMLGLSAEMLAGGAQPGWLPYFKAGAIDAALATASALGAQVLFPPTEVPDVGRFSLLADPQGAPFYLMQPFSDETSTVFDLDGVGRCAWNELSTTDGPAALKFYGELFGWESRETMDMGPMGGYHFLDLGETRLGALVQMQDRPAHWNLYLRVADMDAAVATVNAQGGAILLGPHTVPTGDRIVLGRDPQGAHFALVGPGRA